MGYLNEANGEVFSNSFPFKGLNSNLRRFHSILKYIWCSTIIDIYDLKLSVNYYFVKYVIHMLFYVYI